MWSQSVRHDWVTKNSTAQEETWVEINTDGISLSVCLSVCLSFFHTYTHNFEYAEVVLRLSCSVMSDFCHPMTVAHQLLCLWNFLGKNIGAGCHFLLQGIFSTQGLNLRLLGFLPWQEDSFLLSTWKAIWKLRSCKQITCAYFNQEFELIGKSQ